MPPLVYDIGLHDGGDTGHYLKEGCQVVAVDANPAMCTAAEAQFHNYVRTGQLRIINRGIATCRSQSDFWVCDDFSQWSSFHRAIASRDEAKHHAINVDCVPIAEVIDEFGVGEYMKIDIEGNDRICIAGLTSATAPHYISIEMDHHSCGYQDLEILSNLGYHKFKVICQNNSWHQVTMYNIGLYELGPNHFIIRRLRRVREALSRRFAGRQFGESGPWGEKTSGVWHSLDHAHTVWRSLRDLDQRLDTQGLGWWFDIHARK